MLVILKGEPMAGQDANALDRVAVAGRKDFPRAPGPRVPVTYLIADVGGRAVIRVENAHPFPLEGERYHAPSMRAVPFRQHLIISVIGPFGIRSKSVFSASRCCRVAVPFPRRGPLALTRNLKQVRGD